MVCLSLEFSRLSVSPAMLTVSGGRLGISGGPGCLGVEDLGGCGLLALGVLTKRSLKLMLPSSRTVPASEPEIVTSIGAERLVIRRSQPEFTVTSTSAALRPCGSVMLKPLID